MTDLTRTKLESLSLQKLDPLDLIAPNFRVYELTRSELASRAGVDNRFPGDKELQAAVNLARKVLQPLRAAFGPFTPNSVYRSQELERALKHKPKSWLSTSQHTQGCACDVEIVGKSTLELAQWAADNLPEFDQIICECFDPSEGPNSGWVHISLKLPQQGINRKQLLSYVRDAKSGKWIYVQGLRAAAQ
ncbi:D-Ala-D-Ala carboxypeptidase family metallohydrolase [Niveibacterium terrae]|uniref:D-Ala-D-Ala carboxypeptidase family metallohydrolase n=1 Tax=Niveibacterium terrae TaxID=3373598 RepID=UPI003A953F94